jgi:uncharacterized alkaline shock family protein YloU
MNRMDDRKKYGGVDKKNSLNPMDYGRDFPEERSLGEIKINHDVVANIVRIAAMEVKGVVSVGGGTGFREEIAGIFTRREHTAGIHVDEDENNEYVISVKVVLAFGLELAKTAFDIQTVVREQVTHMTNKKVSKVDVLIDGIKVADKDKVQTDLHFPSS